MTDAKIESDRRADAPVAPEPLDEASSRGLAARRYSVLAWLAARRVRAPAVLDTSPLLRGTGRGSELVATVTFVQRRASSRPRPPRTSRPGGLPRSQAHAGLLGREPGARGPLRFPAPSEAPKAVHYRRTRPAYEQDVHFAEAVRRLGELAGA
jgi:hypothetical protein